MQSHRQGRESCTDRLRTKAERLHEQVTRHRSLPAIDWSDIEQCQQLEGALATAIRAERYRRMSVRSQEWKRELNYKGGANRAARRMVRGTPPRLHALIADGTMYTCPAMQCQALMDGWADIHEGKADKALHPAILEHAVSAPFAIRPLNAEDIALQLAHTKVNTSCGPDWWRTPELRSLPKPALAMLANVFNLMELNGEMPAPLMKGWSRPIPKVGYTAEVLGIRPITILSLVHRVWSSIRFHHLQDWAEQVLHRSQSAFRKGRSAKLEIHKLVMALNARVQANRPCFLGQIDLSKAFPRLNKEKARDAAVRAGMPRSFAQFLHHACLSKTIVWKVAGAISKPVNARRGTPQGCPLSILLFQVIMAPVARSLETFLLARCASSQVMLYADDLVIIATSAGLLQDAMCFAFELLQSLDFEVNINKSM
eukprot:5805327-Amphidinium_carterae.1